MNENLIKNYLVSIDYLKGTEFVNRAMCYARTLLPPEKHSDRATLSVLRKLTDRCEIKYALTDAMMQLSA